ncbi:MAG: tetratricopeptide repeat protein [Planctomycetota bacterium]|nr:tetratricopeptide repeat protein [Planctomycetota bacterium]
MEFPDCPIRLHSLARAYWGADKREMARDKLLEAQKLQPNSLNILLDACGVLTDLENYDEAIRLLLDKAEYFAHSADYHYALGNLFADKGDTEHARKMYLTAIEIDPHHFHALNNLAILLQDRQAPSEQVENFYRRALDANPDDVFANFNYGNFLLVKGRSAEAIDHYHKVIESEPWYVKARIAYAGALLELGRRDEALEEMREIGEEDIISPDEASELGMLYLSANEEETGERLLRSAVRRGEGRSARAFDGLGSFYLEKGEVVEAVKCFIRAVLIKPFDTNLWLKVVASIIEARATFEVSAHIEEFLFEELPEEVEEAERDEIVSVCKVINESVGTREYKSLKPFVRAAWETKQPALLTVLAKLCAFFDRQEEAEKAFRAALKEAPRDIAAHREYIGYLMELGQDKRALQAVRRAMKNVPDETMLENDHALILYRLGRTEEAKQEFFKLSRSKPLEITFVYNYAWMLHQEGHLAPAAGILEQFLSKVGFDSEAAFFCARDTCRNP